MKNKIPLVNQRVRRRLAINKFSVVLFVISVEY